MEPSTRTLAPITSTNEAKASMSTASSTASRTSDSPSKSPLWRLPPDVLTNLQPSYWTRRSSHGPPDGGPAGAVPPAGFVLGGTLLNCCIGLNNRSRSNLIWYLAGQELAVSKVAGEGAALDDALAGQHREGGPSGEVAAFRSRSGLRETASRTCA